MTQMPSGVVIVGAGVAGVSVATALRKDGYTGPVVLVSEEGQMPYDRPPLSKKFLLDGDAGSVSRGREGRVRRRAVLR